MILSTTLPASLPTPRLHIGFMWTYSTHVGLAQVAGDHGTTHLVTLMHSTVHPAPRWAPGRRRAAASLPKERRIAWRLVPPGAFMLGALACRLLVLALAGTRLEARDGGGAAFILCGTYWLDVCPACTSQAA
jgi:hypothetical protein